MRKSNEELVLRKVVYPAILVLLISISSILHVSYGRSAENGAPKRFLWRRFAR